MFKKNKICLELNCSNILALKLYNNLGFFEEKEEKNAIKNKDAILMDLKI